MYTFCAATVFRKNASSASTEGVRLMRGVAALADMSITWVRKWDNSASTDGERGVRILMVFRSARDGMCPLCREFEKLWP
jgi:hypothetical protein